MENKRNIQFIKGNSAEQIIVEIVQESSRSMSYRFPDGNVHEFVKGQRGFDFTNHSLGTMILHSTKGPIHSRIAGPDRTEYEIWAIFGHQIALRPSKYFSGIENPNDTIGIATIGDRELKRREKEISVEEFMTSGFNDEDDDLFEGKVLNEAMAKFDFFNGARAKFQRSWKEKIGGPYLQSAESLYMEIIKRDFSVIHRLIENKKYVQWVRYCFLQYDEIEGQYQLYEEIGRWNHAINIFDDFAKRGSGRDIFAFDSVSSLEKFLSSKGMMELQTSLSAKEIFSMIETGLVEKVVENEKYLILSPNSSKACVYLGKGTDWCISKYGENDARTAAANARYGLFSGSSNPESKIYIIFAKNEKKRWAIQLKGREFKQENEQTEKDSEIRKEIVELLRSAIGKAANVISTI